MADSKSTVESLVQEGLELYSQGDLDRALERWRAALELVPDYSRATEYIHYVETNRVALERSFQLAAAHDSTPAGTPIADGGLGWQVDTIDDTRLETGEGEEDRGGRIPTVELNRGRGKRGVEKEQAEDRIPTVELRLHRGGEGGGEEASDREQGGEIDSSSTLDRWPGERESAFREGEDRQEHGVEQEGGSSPPSSTTGPSPTVTPLSVMRGGGESFEDTFEPLEETPVGEEIPDPVKLMSRDEDRAGADPDRPPVERSASTARRVDLNHEQVLMGEDSYLVIARDDESGEIIIDDDRQGARKAVEGLEWESSRSAEHEFVEERSGRIPYSSRRPGSCPAPQTDRRLAFEEERTPAADPKARELVRLTARQDEITPETAPSSEDLRRLAADLEEEARQQAGQDRGASVGDTAEQQEQEGASEGKVAAAPGAVEADDEELDWEPVREMDVVGQQPEPEEEPALGDGEDATSMLAQALHKEEEEDFEGALDLCDRILDSDPDNAAAQELAQSCRRALLRQYWKVIGDLTRVPIVQVPRHQIVWQKLDSRAGFLLSRIDGLLTFEDIIDVSGMDEFEASSILAQLITEEIVGIKR